MGRRKYKVVVEIDVEDVTIDQVGTYVADALRSHGGAFRPEDPFFGLTKEDIRVALVTRLSTFSKAAYRDHLREVAASKQGNTDNG